MFFQSRLISQGRFFSLDFDILTKHLNNNSPCCPDQSSSINQSCDTLLTWFPVCGKIQFFLVWFLSTARANNVHLMVQMVHLSVWQRFPDLSKSSLVSNTEMHLMIYLESYISENTALKKGSAVSCSG